MPKTSSAVTRIPGRPGPVANNPPKSMQSGTAGVRAKRGPGEWSPITWNSREPEKAVRPIVEEGSQDKDKKKPPQIAYPMEGVSDPARPRSEDDETENIPEARPLRPLTAKPLDSWPNKVR